MPIPEIVIAPDEVVPVERWQLWDEQFSVKTKDEATGRDVDFFYSLMYPIFPLNYVSPTFLAYGYRNIWRVDAITGERLEQFPVQIGELEKLKVSYPEYAQKVANIALSNEARKWGINKENLPFFPEIQSRLANWADALATGDKIDRGGAFIPPIDDMPNLINRIRTFIPPSNFTTSLLRTKEDVDKVNAVRQAWATALQRGDIDFGSQAQYTSMFARTLFEGLLPREDMDVGDFQRVMRLVETPQGFQNFIQTVNRATQKAGEQGLSPEGTQELIKELTSRNILERLGLEAPTGVLSQPSQRVQPIQGTQASIPRGKDIMSAAYGGGENLAGAIIAAREVGLETSGAEELLAEGIRTRYQNMALVASASESLNKQVAAVRAESLSKTSQWLQGQFPERFKEWETAIFQRLGVAKGILLHPRYRDAFLAAALMDEQTSIDPETGIRSQWYLPGLKQEVETKLGPEAMEWLQKRQPSVNWAVPREVTVGMERIREYNKRQTEYDVLREQARIERERVKKVAKI